MSVNNEELLFERLRVALESIVDDEHDRRTVAAHFRDSLRPLPGSIEKFGLAFSTATDVDFLTESTGSGHSEVTIDVTFSSTGKADRITVGDVRNALLAVIRDNVLLSITFVHCLPSGGGFAWQVRLSVSDTVCTELLNTLREAQLAPRAPATVEDKLVEQKRHLRRSIANKQRTERDETVREYVSARTRSSNKRTISTRSYKPRVSPLPRITVRGKYTKELERARSAPQSGTTFGGRFAAWVVSSVPLASSLSSIFAPKKQAVAPTSYEEAYGKDVDLFVVHE